MFDDNQTHLWCHACKPHTSSDPTFPHTQSMTSHFFYILPRSTLAVPTQPFHPSWLRIAKSVIIVMLSKIWLSVLSVSAACRVESSNSQPKSTGTAPIVWAEPFALCSFITKTRFFFPCYVYSVNTRNAPIAGFILHATLTAAWLFYMWRLTLLIPDNNHTFFCLFSSHKYVGVFFLTQWYQHSSSYIIHSF